MLFGDSTSSFGKLPKVGDPDLKITIKDAYKKDLVFEESNLKYNPNLHKSGGVDVGYHYVIVDEDDKTYIINSWVLFFAIQDSQATVGDTIQIKHAERGKWFVRKLDNNKPAEKEDHAIKPEDIQWED